MDNDERLKRVSADVQRDRANYCSSVTDAVVWYMKTHLHVHLTETGQEELHILFSSRLTL